MHVIGTAGHVDHGKSTLVEALTGVHPDRLKEEREREMTIDLGFAWLTLPGGEEIGIIDVPGHRDFIENMLAGVGGVDAAMFVIAADEGVMPQTREHLAILNLLQIQGGVVALTKTDLATDADWLDMVEEDVRAALKGTVLEDAPILRVSARHRQGLPQLLQALQDCLKDRPSRPDYGRPRLPVDRIFSIAGFGTVVTGTLSDGRLTAGDEIEIMPAGLKGRVRGLQTHKKKEMVAVPGSRTAVNISGVALEQLRRGDVVARPGSYTTTQRLDVSFKLLADASSQVKHNMEVKFFIGAAEVLARLRLLGVEELNPGEEGWLQLELAEPVVAVRGDRYILRRPSPGETIGGGSVVDPHPRGRHKRFSDDNLERLRALARGTPAEILLQALLALGIAPLKDVITRSNLDAADVPQALEELIESSLLVSLEMNAAAGGTPGRETLVTSRASWENLGAKTVAEVDAYHRQNPLRRGMPREELKSRLGLQAKVYNILVHQLAGNDILVENGPLVLCPGHEIRFSPQQQRQIASLLERFSAAPFGPPSVKETQAEVGEDVYAALLDQGELVQVSPEVVFNRRGYDDLVSGTRKLMAGGVSLTAAQVRDHFNTSRKYILALLEHLDATGVTVRQGDTRRLK